MRGVVTLAAVFTLPESTPHREVLVFIALTVTAGTLLVQGSTLPWLVRRLRLPGPDPAEDALQEAAVLQGAHRAAEEKLQEIVMPDDPPEVVTLLRQRGEARAQAEWERLGRPESELRDAERGLPPVADLHARGRADGCEEYLADGTSWVHLRLCLGCGHVGCCDSSVMKHASRHYVETHHPVMRSFEPGENWRWCFVDEKLG